VNGPDELAAALGERFPTVDGFKLRRNPAFRTAADAVLRLLDVVTVVHGVADYGELNAVRSPYRVLVIRLRWLAEDCARRERLAAKRADEFRRRPLVDAERRGQELGWQVGRSLITEEDATATIGTEFSDPDLAAVALANLRVRP
jgi:hypothetical protein